MSQIDLEKEQKKNNASCKFKEARKACGLTQKEVADMLGVTAATYSRYESGIIQPNPKTLKRISTLLNTSIDFLLDSRSKNNSSNSLSEFIRVNRGDMSLRDFAKKCGNISHTQIDSIEKGIDSRTGKPVCPTVETLSKISKGTGASVAFLASLTNGDNTDLLNFTRDAIELLKLFNQMNENSKLRILGAAYTILAEQKTGELKE